MHQEDNSLMKSARHNFVKKVYTTLSIQLLITIIVVCYSIQSKSFSKMLKKKKWIFYTSILGTVVTFLALAFAKVTKKVPLNYILMGVFTLCESIVVAYACKPFTAASILLSASATLAATLGLTIFAITTKQDFLEGKFMKQGYYHSIFCIVFTVSILHLLLPKSSMYSCIVAILCGIFYNMFLISDTQKVLGNSKRSLDLDDYILGATIIYLDIIEMFLDILSILGEGDD